MTTVTTMELELEWLYPRITSTRRLRGRRIRSGLPIWACSLHQIVIIITKGTSWALTLITCKMQPTTRMGWVVCCANRTRQSRMERTVRKRSWRRLDDESMFSDLMMGSPTRSNLLTLSTRRRNWERPRFSNRPTANLTVSLRSNLGIR